MLRFVVLVMAMFELAVVVLCRLLLLLRVRLCLLPPVPMCLLQLWLPPWLGLHQWRMLLWLRLGPWPCCRPCWCSW